MNENADTIVKTHIKLLHQYNEAKDATQVSNKSPIDVPEFNFLIDSHWSCTVKPVILLIQYNLFYQLATARGSTIKQIHEEYDLKDCD